MRAASAPPMAMAMARAMATAAAAALVLLSGCASAPPYDVPSAPVPTAFRDGGRQTPLQSSPASAEPWWAVFDDPELDRLERAQEAQGAQLKIAVARFDQAAALARQAQSARWPRLGAGAAAARQESPGEAPENAASLTAFASYEVDLWGRVWAHVAAGRADAEASQADLAAVRLSLQAQLADAYFQLRGAEAQIEVLASTSQALERALELTRRRYAGDIASGLDTGRAETQLSATEAQHQLALARRALLEHQIAVLVGQAPSDFSITPSAELIAAPAIPVGAPSQLLKRRPDIVVAERRVAAANARIGVARAAWFPQVTLAASGGYQSANGQLLDASNRVWALGPLAAALPLIDGGSRKAEVARARAAFEEAAADYKLTVLEAFGEVEDQMALADRLAKAQERQDAAVAAAARTRALATTRYREGAADYLAVVTAQAAELDARRTALELRAQRLSASVGLIRALGGGWTGLAD